MSEFDLVSNWLNTVSYSRSQSKATEEQYKRVWGRFSAFIGKKAEQIEADYKASEERDFRRKYAQYIQGWIAALSKEGLTNTSIKVMVGAVKSFFKWNNLPLGLVPQPMSGIVYHNRDLTKEEIIQIMAVSKLREKAFFVVMAQSGLRPHTIRQLKLKHLESLDKLPCKIEVPKEMAKGKYGSYVTFIGPDALKYVKQYFVTRTNLTPDDLIFCSHDDSTKPVNVKDMSRAFRLAARKLEKSGAIDFEVRAGKPSELRLYNLRKFFRKQAHQMGFENVNYLMGHTVRGSYANYKPQDPEFYRQLYEEKAMPFLRLETATPTETEKTIVELKRQLGERDKEIVAMKETMAKLQPLVDWVNSYPTIEQMKEELGLTRQYSEDDKLYSYDTVKEALSKFERAEAKREALAREKGLPLTKEDYERKKRLDKKTNP
jgi:site-specific recombinase XerC